MTDLTEQLLDLAELAFAWRKPSLSRSLARRHLHGVRQRRSSQRMGGAPARGWRRYLVAEGGDAAGAVECSTWRGDVAGAVACTAGPVNVSRRWRVHANGA
jgi:hypothetical protein